MYNNALNQFELFAKKIYDEHFFTEDLFDVENNTYNYDLIKERLSMTSFKSAEEFVQEYEDMFYSVQKLVKKNPNFADPFLQEKIEKELYNQHYYKSSKRGIATCLVLCTHKYESCITTAGNYALAALALCGITGFIIPVAAPIAWGVCGASAVIAYWIAKHDCSGDIYYCKKGCHNSY